jgi:glycosyltransferase involved in cell wall biosynthesis
MSYGNCVLVSDIEENVEAIGNSGCTFRNKQVGDLKRQLEYLLDRDDVVKAFREKACKDVQRRYNWDTVTEQFEVLYRSLIVKE